MGLIINLERRKMSNTDATATQAPKRRLGFATTMLYSIGNMSGTLVSMPVGMYLMYYYCPPDQDKQLISISVMTALIFFGRFFDGFLEPIVGYYSDRTKTRWGRRIPFIAVGGLPLAAFFIMYWYPPFAPNTFAMGAYILIVNTCFWSCITLVFCPYLGLLPDIAPEGKDRLVISQLMQVFMFAGTAIVLLLQSKFTPISENPWIFIVMGGLCLITIYSTVFGVKEKELSVVREDEEDYSLLEALKWTFTNKAFLIYLISTLFNLLGTQTLQNGLMYIVTVILGRKESDMIQYFGILIGSVFASFFIIQKLCEKYSKKTVNILCSVLLGLMLPLEYLLTQPAIFGIPTTTLSYIMFIFLGFPFAGLMCLGLPILADIADYDEKLHGRRREAIFFGAQGILQKFVIAFTFLIQGQLFNIFGYAKDNPLGVQLLGPVTGAFVLLGALVFAFYPLNEKTLTIEPSIFARRRASKYPG